MHISGIPIILCAHQVNESEHSDPFIRLRCFSESKADPPQEPSMWNHRLYCLQMMAISSIGSNTPLTVVPAVAPMKNGLSPFLIDDFIEDTSFLRFILPWPSQGIILILLSPIPDWRPAFMNE